MAGDRGDHRRDISHNQIGNQNLVIQGNIDGSLHYHSPHQPARAGVVRVIPYPRNEDMVHRRDLIDRLDKLLPHTSGFSSAALWGLGGSGYVSMFVWVPQINEARKTQIALDYAYRRCDNDSECSIFWVHADNEATFISDYKTIGKKLGVGQLDGSDLLDAVCSEIGDRARWVMILDNADDLRLFGVGGRREGNSEYLLNYVPHTSRGTILWTSRDAHITGTVVGPRQGVEVRSMTTDEATTLLTRVRDEESTVSEAGVGALLEELEHLPLAISQAGAYIRRMSMTVEEYLSLLVQGKTRWEVLKMSDSDRHRRPEVSNSVLETWKISTERIRAESEMTYRMLHVIAYVDRQDIPHDLIVAASRHETIDDEAYFTEIEIQQAVMRLMEFSFLALRRSEDGRRSYEMHKLVQEAIRYELKVRGTTKKMLGEMLNRSEDGEGYYSSIALQIVDSLLPESEGKPWAQCELYMAHAIRVGEWAEVNGKEVDTSRLLSRVSGFLADQGRWRETEPVNARALELRRGVLGEKHPDTIKSMASLATTYHEQGRYDEAEQLKIQALGLRREVLGEKHPDTINSMASLAATYYEQGRYDEAKQLEDQVLDLRQEVRGEKHPHTIRSMANLAVIYHKQGRYDEAEQLKMQALDLRREVLGEKHPDTISSMMSLAVTCHAQGRYDEAESISIKALDLRREVLGEKHPDTINSMADLAVTYHAQGRYDEAEVFHKTALDLRRRILGEHHPHTTQSIFYLASTQESLQQSRSVIR